MIQHRWLTIWELVLKEHNGDYLDDVTLLEHIQLLLQPQTQHINILQETKAYLHLAKVEEKLYSYGLIEKPSNTYNVLLDKAIKSKRWKKWMLKEDADLTVEEILVKIKSLRMKYLILRVITFNDEEVKKRD